jgi:hypothetical protein
MPTSAKEEFFDPKIEHSLLVFSPHSQPGILSTKTKLIDQMFFPADSGSRVNPLNPRFLFISLARSSSLISLSVKQSFERV